MVDPIDVANKAAQQNLPSSIPTELPKPPIDKLPKVKDPELIKKEKEALVQQKVATTKQDVLQKKSKVLETLKNLALGVAAGLFGGIAGRAQGALAAGTAALTAGAALVGLFRKKKLPSKQTLDTVKADIQTKEVEKERVQTSRENHKKNVETFTYPLTPTDVQNKPTVSPPAPSALPIQPPIPTPTPKPLEYKYIIVDFRGIVSTPPVDILVFFSSTITDGSLTVDEYVLQELKKINDTARPYGRLTSSGRAYEIRVPVTAFENDALALVSSTIATLNATLNKRFVPRPSTTTDGEVYQIYVKVEEK